MNFKKVLSLLIPEFQQQEVDFALIGGLALHFVGVIRTTVDLDLVVLLAQSDIVHAVMEKYGYTRIHCTEDVANYTSPFKELGQVDFLFAHRQYARDMLNRAVTRSLLEYNVKVIQPEDLIGLKVQSSSNDPQRYHRDMADIEEIIKNNYQTLNWMLLAEYFRLFNREQELNALKEKIK